MSELTHYALELLDGPVAEPLERAAVKRWLKIDADVTEEDDDVDDLIREARERAERVTGRTLCTATFRLTLDGFPCGNGAILIPGPRLYSIGSIKYDDVDEVEQTLAADLYQADSASEPARVVPALGQTWPATAAKLGAVRIEFVAGTAAANVSAELKSRMRAVIAYCYRNREDRDEQKLDGTFASLWTGNLIV